MIEASAPSTGESLACVTKCCARPTGDSHGITRGPTQRRGGAKRRPHCLEVGKEQRGQQQTLIKVYGPELRRVLALAKNLRPRWWQLHKLPGRRGYRLSAQRRQG